MITGTQMRAARALLGLDQRALAQRCGLSLPTIQRMEASDGVVRGNVNSLMKLVDALAAGGIELIGEGASEHWRRPRSAAEMRGRLAHPQGGAGALMVVYALFGVLALVVLAPSRSRWARPRKRPTRSTARASSSH